MALNTQDFDALCQITTHHQTPEQWAQQLLPLLDLTYLAHDAPEEKLADLCAKATSAFGTVAGICTFSEYLTHVQAPAECKRVTVVNFPAGDAPIEAVLPEIQKGLDAGAEEIDVVIPYACYHTQAPEEASQTIRSFVTHCAKACAPQADLKIILETGALKAPELIYQASLDALSGGAHFIKTSTGKIETGATPQAAAAMLLALRDVHKDTQAGIKLSGGIRTTKTAAHYLAMAQHCFGAEWTTPETFRIGASTLINELLQILEGSSHG